MTANAFLRKYSFKAFDQAAALIPRIVPVQNIYAMLFRLCRLQALLFRPMIGMSPYRNDPRRNIVVAWLMDSWLQPLSRRRLVFPIPIHTDGKEALARASRNPNGMLISSVHLPLVNCVLRSLVDMGITPATVVALTDDENSPVWGLNQGIPALAPSGSVLLKLKAVLRQGRTVAALVDTAPGTPLNPNIFHLVRYAGAEVVFATVELQPNGEILVQFSTPPDPFCRDAESIEANLRALRHERQHILNPSSRCAATKEIPLLSLDDTEPAEPPKSDPSYLNPAAKVRVPAITEASDN
jgi:hypothetical protein